MMLQTNIQKAVMGDGSVRYYPRYRYRDTDPFIYYSNSYLGIPFSLYFSDVHQAKRYIDEQYKYEVKSTETIDYP